LYGKFDFFDSTISHIGFILLALSINTEQSIESLIFYIIQYTISNLAIFLIIIGFGFIIKPIISTPGEKAVAPHAGQSSISAALASQGQVEAQQVPQSGDNNTKDIELIYDIKGQFFVNPILSISLTICLFSMAGKNKC
jgi:NADH-ubiquinone oxidoreductase chain 2